MAANMQNWVVGQEVECPKCGKRGKVGIDKFRAGGKEYYYWTVRHYEGHRVRRCVIARTNGPEKPLRRRGVTAAPAASEEVEKLREENERLRSELARLEEENARLREENRQLREAIATVYNARLVQAGPQERRGFYLAAVRHRKGEVPRELRPVIDGMLETLSSVDWVAVRMDAFEQLRGLLA
jgi:transposase-like protein